MPPRRLAHRHRVLACALAGLAACATGAPRRAAAPAAGGRVLVLAGEEAELEALRRSTAPEEVRVVNGSSIHLGRLGGQPVALALSGRSLVNAAMTTEALLGQLPVRAVLLTGPGIAANPELRPGDVAVPGRWASYQERVFARASPAPGAGPGRAAEPDPRPTEVTTPGSPPDQLEARFWFPAEPAALERARAVADRALLARCAAGGAPCLGRAPRLVVGGPGVSGDTFLDDPAFRAWLWEGFRADVVDGEAAAVATVAHVHGAPFVAFRTLVAPGDAAGPAEREALARLAAENTAALVVAYLQALGPPAAAVAAAR